jgi:hypothetical protein
MPGASRSVPICGITDWPRFRSVPLTDRKKRCKVFLIQVMPNILFLLAGKTVFI